MYYVNVGEGNNRCWEDCRQFGYMSAGQHPKYSDPIRTLEIGDIVAAYLKRYGYVGIGRVTKKAVRANSFKINGKLLSRYNLKMPNIYTNADNENSEFMVKVDWIKSVDRKDAKWKSKSKLFSSQLIKASLENQQRTVDFLESEFEIDFKELFST